MTRRCTTAALAATALAATAVLTACSGGVDGPDPETGVGVQLFQWTWDAIAAECTDTLGPAGYAWVLTSPPQEHVVGPEWWVAYQPVSHRIESRLGTREQFADMVDTCHEAGVAVVADAVINHMSGSSDGGTGWAGTVFEHRSYPGLFGPEDFHPVCDTPEGDIVDYDDAEQVQTCELVNLADLDTGSERVRDTLAAYLEDLRSLGVDGFRIDAAKHISVEDLTAILDRVDGDPLVVLEVIRGAGEPIQPEDYAGLGQVFEFGWGRAVRSIVDRARAEQVAELGSGLGTAWLPSQVARVFVDNHDTERNASTLSYAAGDRYLLANVLMLAGGYGRPVVYSGYAFPSLDTGVGPRTDAAGRVLDASCPAEVGPGLVTASQDWVCQHRWPGVLGMVGFANAVGDAPQQGMWTSGDVVAFSRGDRGLVVVNLGAEDVTGLTVTGSLPQGRYCDVVAGPPTAQGCAGDAVEVAADGSATLDLPARTAVALHVGAPAEG